MLRDEDVRSFRNETACMTLSPTQENWVLGFQILVCTYNTGLLFLGAYNIYQYLANGGGRHRTLSVFLFYVMGMLTLASVMASDTVVKQSNPNEIAAYSAGYIFGTFGILCVGWTQAACMLELVLRLKYVTNSETGYQVERKAQYA